MRGWLPPIALPGLDVVTPCARTATGKAEKHPVAVRAPWVERSGTGVRGKRLLSGFRRMRVASAHRSKRPDSVVRAKVLSAAYPGWTPE